MLAKIYKAACMYLINFADNHYGIFTKFELYMPVLNSVLWKLLRYFLDTSSSNSSKDQQSNVVQRHGRD